jgi:hypothetical protein
MFVAFARGQATMIYRRWAHPRLVDNRRVCPPSLVCRVPKRGGHAGLLHMNLKSHTDSGHGSYRRQAWRHERVSPSSSSLSGD